MSTERTLSFILKSVDLQSADLQSVDLSLPLRSFTARFLWLSHLILCISCVSAYAQDLAPQDHGVHDHGVHDHGAHLQASPAAEAGDPTAQAPLSLVRLPDTELVDQEGRTVHLRELVAGRRAAINFIFTSCTTVCPPMGALFARLQRDLEARGDDVAYISISIDPAVDSPQRLKAWAERFDGSEDWRLLTGSKQIVDDLLKDLGVFSALKEQHAPLILLGDPRSQTWIRAHGLAPPRDLIAVLDQLPSPIQTSGAGNSEAREYFTDTVLVDQNGQEHRFYTDLVAGRTVVINPFFATCSGSCPVMHRALRQAQATLADRLGDDVFFLSITVDPDGDTPERLRAYAEAFDAGPGWSFLTGPQANVQRILAKLGQQVSQKEAHQAIFLVGNERTGLWQKVFGLGPPEDLLAAVQAVADDPAAPILKSTNSDETHSKTLAVHSPTHPRQPSGGSVR